MSFFQFRSNNFEVVRIWTIIKPWKFSNDQRDDQQIIILLNEFDNISIIRAITSRFYYARNWN